MTKKKERIPDLKSLARNHTLRAVQVIAGVMDASKNDANRIAAADLLLCRGWGRPNQTHTGEDGGAIEIILRNLAAEKKK